MATVSESKKKQNFSHIISIRLDMKEINEKFNSLKNSILDSVSSKKTKFYDVMFQRPEKLHLTLCLLSLSDKEEQQAIQDLKYFKEDFLDPLLEGKKDINIRLQGLACMQDNPRQAKVLYAKVEEETGLLQIIANAVNKYFECPGITGKIRDPVLLHATVMNTVFYRKKNKFYRRIRFNARKILKNFQDVQLGTQENITIRLSKTCEVSPDGYYRDIAEISL